MEITKIVIHCSDSPDEMDVGAKEIHKWHKERPYPFSGIGYHHVITRQGAVEAGRPHYWEGAHVSGHNAGSIGICLVGRNEFTDAQMSALKNLLYWLRFIYQDASVVGHSDLDPNKTCPNFDLRSWMDEEMPGFEHVVRH